MTVHATSKPDWRLTVDLNLTSSLARSCAWLLRDHPDEEVLEAGRSLEAIACTLDDALEGMPANMRELVNASLAKHRIDLG